MDKPLNANFVTKAEELADRNGWRGNRAYLVRKDAGTFEIYTLDDAYTAIRGTAAVLAAARIRPGDRVLIALPDGIGFVRSFLAALYSGAIAVPVNPMLPARELAALIERSEPAVILGGPALAGAAGGVTIIGPGQLAGDPAAAPPAAACAPDSLAYALFTSGTTGAPKLVFHTHADPFGYDKAFCKPVLNLQPGAVTLSVSKSFYSYGLVNSVMYPLLNGSAAVLDPAVPNEESILSIIERFGIDVLFSVPSVYARLLAHPAAGALNRVRIAMCSGEVLPKAVEDGMARLGGPALLNCIGSTEVGVAYASNTVDSHRPRTAGRPLLPYEIRIVDDAGNGVPAGTEGSLLVRGPTISAGSSSAREPLPRRAGEWHPTGDAATLDKDGFLRIHGRVDDVEIVGGVNLRPAEIEELFVSQPDVSDAAVCAVADGEGVSRLIAYVVPKQDGPDDALKGALITGLRGKVASHKIPHMVVFVPGLPRTATGKLRRRVLREAGAVFQATGLWQI
jgi:fatty acid CoA ligase FadD22